jgi:hypothetical protein
MNATVKEIQKLTDLFAAMSISISSKSILTRMNTMELGIGELIYYLENFHISIPPKSALTTENLNTTDIDRLTSLLKYFHILTSSKGTQESRMNIADIQNLIDLFGKSLISKPSKFIPATINITEVQNPKYFTEIEIASIATASTGAQGSLPTTTDVTSASSVSSSSSSKLISFIDFNDRSPEARDARLANLLLSLDEDIPEEVDDTIKTLIKNQTTTTMKFGDHFLEYKQQMATKRLTEKRLPTSAARSSHQKSPSPRNHTNAL